MTDAPVGLGMVPAASPFYAEAFPVSGVGLHTVVLTSTASTAQPLGLYAFVSG